MRGLGNCAFFLPSEKGGSIGLEKGEMNRLYAL